HARIGLKGNRRFAHSTTLSGYDDDPIGTPGPIYCGSGSILEHLDRGDILRIDGGKDTGGLDPAGIGGCGTDRIPVNDIQGFTAAQYGVPTPDTDGGRTTGRCIGLDDLHPGYLTLKGLFGGCHRKALDLVLLDGGHTSREITFL